MTQSSRTTESISRDNAAIRDIMHQVRELTVPDRATLAVGLVGHLATMMNRKQMEKLMGELQEQVERVQDIPPNRQLSDTRAAGLSGADERTARGGQLDGRAGGSAQDRPSDDTSHDGVGQSGRGEFRARKLV